MDKEAYPLPPLLPDRIDLVGDRAFSTDVLNRKDLAERLTGYIGRLQSGAVLAIDAPWGEGKSWFGRNWAKQLEEKGHKVAFIDAFEQDYVEDPFLLLAAEIANVLDDGQAAHVLRERAARVLAAIMPAGESALINIANRLALGMADIAGRARESAGAARVSTAEASAKWIEQRVDSHIHDKATIEYFRGELTRLASSHAQPIVLFIDELDRCRPTFAVRLIERLKHFFDVPNLVFVLLLNRVQLEKAIKGTYGPETDAATYLGKFINFFFTLPKQVSLERNSNDHVKTYVRHVFRRYAFGNQAENFKEHLTWLAPCFNLSLRDVERAVALYACAYPFSLLPNLFAYVIVLKVSRAELFRRLMQGDRAAHHEAQDAISQLRAATGESSLSFRYLTMFSDWHDVHITGVVGGMFKAVVDELWRYNLEAKQLFGYLAAQIDLPMSD